ncbi:MAG: hypothetical protein AAF390_00055 [Pseudomonadota bacterium]
MTAFQLEDFGSATRPVGTPVEPADTMAPSGAYEDGYNAGWDDALAQIEEERGRIGETLAERLSQIEQTREDAIGRTLSALEPMLHEVFDKILPRAAERGFLSLLLQEAEAMLSEADAGLTLLVAPEELPALDGLLASRDDLSDVVTARAEPALALSQAILSWEGGQRRMDLQAVMSALDTAFEEFLARGQDTQTPKEAVNG